MRIFNKQIEEDKRIVISRSNLSELHKVHSRFHCSLMYFILFGFHSAKSSAISSLSHYLRDFVCSFQVLEEHELSCMDLLHVNTDGVVLTKQSKKLICRSMFRYKLFATTRTPECYNIIRSKTLFSSF